jgi:hypothetical protein
MKNLTPIWFVMEPIDQEHKEYILLDYLKSISKNLDQKNCYNILKSVSRIIKILNNFKKNKNFIAEDLKTINSKDLSYIKGFNFNLISKEKREEIMIIIENSLETLYEYSEIFLEMLKDEESKIKIFRVQSRFSSPDALEVKSGILIIRNMINDKIIPYYWQGSVIMRTSEGNKNICLLKKIPIKNSRYSMNYEYIYHEILDSFSVEKNVSPELFVMEIYEDFDEESEIYKLAKEKFIETIS